MFKLKEFYQYKRDLLKRNKAFQSQISPTFLSLNFPFVSGVENKTFRSQISPSHCIVSVKASVNNTILTLTDLKGRVIFVRSCGCLGFKGKKKRTTKFAIKSTIFAILTKIKELKWNSVILSLNGFAKGRYYIYESFQKSDLNLSLITDNTAIPHNGCRPKKLRRG